jgi:hypothetical protein
MNISQAGLDMFATSAVTKNAIKYEILWKD